jgi:hypothetical protein
MRRRIGLLGLIDGIEDCVNTGQHSSQNGNDSDGIHNRREQDIFQAVLYLLEESRKIDASVLHIKLLKDNKTDVKGRVIGSLS